MYEGALEKIRDAGVVGAGGAGFPTHVKIAANAEYVIVNGAECEPLIKVDQQLMAVNADKVIEGLEIVMRVAGAQYGIIALKNKYKEAISSLSKHITGKPMELFMLDDFYPAGDEQVAVYEVLKRIVPAGGIPLKVGCVVTNVETLINIAGAVKGLPVTHTYLTIAGAVPNPVTLKLPIGTSVKEAVALAGKETLEGMAVIDGGPMMGKMVEDFSQPITKTTKALLVLPQNHPLIQKRTMPFKNVVKQLKSACIQCQRCTDLCPRYLLGHKLEPHKIMRSLNLGHSAADVLKMSFLCSECGACEHYACPNMLSPRQINAKIKKELAQNGIKPNPTDKAPVANGMREYRKIPVKRLKIQLGVNDFDLPAPLSDQDYEPSLVKIPISKHIGKSSIPMVEVGQFVEKGALIARIPENSLGANIHASISGTVAEVSDHIVIVPLKKGVVKNEPSHGTGGI